MNFLVINYCQSFHTFPLTQPIIYRKHFLDDSSKWAFNFNKANTFQGDGTRRKSKCSGKGFQGA